MTREIESQSLAQIEQPGAMLAPREHAVLMPTMRMLAKRRHGTQQQKESDRPLARYGCDPRRRVKVSMRIDWSTPP